MAQSDVQTIQTAANCLSCIPTGLQPAVQTMLLANKAGGSVDPQTLLTAAECLACLDGMQDAVQIYALAILAGASTDPQILSALAGCFRCLDGNQGPAMTYLECTWLNGGCVAPAAPSNTNVTTSVWPGPITITWDYSGTRPTTFEIYAQINGGDGAPFTFMSSISGAGALTYQDNTSYGNGDLTCYKVRACNDICCSAFSNIDCQMGGNPA